MRAHPLCADCQRLAQCVHHIVPRHVAPDRMYDTANVVSLCNECHDARHR
jgi:5-methylcytosine-specific restriction endonuclease McrA